MARPLAELGVLNILDRVADAIVVVDSRGTIVYVNAAAAVMFGYAADELLGQTTEVLVPEASRGTHAHVRRRYHAEPVARGMGSGLPLEARRSDGSVITVDIKLEPVEGWVVASIRPVAGRSRGEQELLDTLETVGQHLFAVGMSLAALRTTLPETATARVDDTTDLVDRTLELARREHSAHC